LGREQRGTAGIRTLVDRLILAETAGSPNSLLAALGQPGDRAEGPLPGTVANWRSRPTPVLCGHTRQRPFGVASTEAELHAKEIGA
jgi:hypothetical protein